MIYLMRQYTKDWFKSRKKDVDSRVKCEIPLCWRPIADIHHIESSFRWPRTHNKDWSDIVWLCRKHHDQIHSKNNSTTRWYLLELVRDILDDNFSADIPKSWNKEKKEYFSEPKSIS